MQRSELESPWSTVRFVRKLVLSPEVIIRIGLHGVVIIIIIIIIILFTAIGLLPGGNGYFTCIQNMKLVTTKFKSGGLHEKHVVATWKLGKRWPLKCRG